MHAQVYILVFGLVSSSNSVLGQLDSNLGAVSNFRIERFHEKFTYSRRGLDPNETIQEWIFSSRVWCMHALTLSSLVGHTILATVSMH